MENLKRIRNWKKGVVFVVLCIAAICFPLHAKAEGADEEVTIYGLGSGFPVEGNGLKTIGPYCFRGNGSLVFIRIPDSVTALGAYAFSYCDNLKHIYFYGNAPEFGGTIEDTFYDGVFYYCKAKAYYPKGNATWTKDVLKDHDGTIT